MYKEEREKCIYISSAVDPECFRINPFKWDSGSAPPPPLQDR